MIKRYIHKFGNYTIIVKADSDHNETSVDVYYKGTLIASGLENLYVKEEDILQSVKRSLIAYWIELELECAKLAEIVRGFNNAS